MSTFRRAALAVLFACLICSPLHADDALADGGDEAASEPTSVLSDQIEIVVNGGLRSDRVTEHGVSVSLRNISEEELTGPFGITIDGTGVEDLQVVFPEVDGVTKNYFEVVRDTAVLRPNQTSRPVRIEFRSTIALTFVDRNYFALAARVVRPEDIQDEEVASSTESEFVPGKEYTWEEMYEAFANQNEWTPFLMDHDGVIGTATAEDDAGNLVIRVYTTRHGVIKELPASLGGMDLQQNVVGAFVGGPAQGSVIRPGGGAAISYETREELNHGLGRHITGPALDASMTTPTGGTASLSTPAPSVQTPLPSTPPGAPGLPNYTPQSPIGPPSVPMRQYTGHAGPPGDPTIRFDRPVPIGVSSSNMLGECISGTIGCRVIDSAGNVYGLGSNHTWAVENLGLIGDPIVQPSLADVVPACEEFPLDTIGLLSDFEPLDLGGLNVMDCALMETTPALLQAETPDDGYGSPSRTIVGTPFVGLEVQKYGRTTLLTRGRIIGLNVNALITLTNGDYQFVSLIEYANDIELFAVNGDSGALIVTRDGNRPVALHIAGGGGSSLGSPIMPVLERFNVFIDDGSLTPAPPIFSISGRMGIATGPVVPTPVTIP